MEYYVREFWTEIIPIQNSYLILEKEIYIFQLHFMQLLTLPTRSPVFSPATFCPVKLRQFQSLKFSHI